MKMIYQIKHTNNKPNLLGKYFFRALVIILFVLIFSIPNRLRSSALDSFSPLFKIGNSFYQTFFQIPKIFSGKNEILEENAKLLEEIANMRINLIDYESIKDENIKLYRELGLKSASTTFAVKVIAKPPQVSLDSLLIDNGSNNGVEVGDMVLVHERILIGRIVKVSANRSTIALSSFPKVVSYGYVERTSEPLEIEGVGGGGLQAKVPIDFDIKLQDKITLDGSLTYAVAVVRLIEEDYASGFKKILMSLPVNVSKIRLVFIEPASNE